MDMRINLSDSLTFSTMKHFISQFEEFTVNKSHLMEPLFGVDLPSIMVQLLKPFSLSAILISWELMEILNLASRRKFLFSLVFHGEWGCRA